MSFVTFIECACDAEDWFRAMYFQQVVQDWATFSALFLWFFYGHFLSTIFSYVSYLCVFLHKTAFQIFCPFFEIIIRTFLPFHQTFPCTPPHAPSNIWLLFFAVIVCIYVYTYIPCSVLVCMFSGLAVWHCTIDCAHPQLMRGAPRLLFPTLLSCLSFLFSLSLFLSGFHLNAGCCESSGHINM